MRRQAKEDWETELLTAIKNSFGWYDPADAVRAALTSKGVDQLYISRMLLGGKGSSLASTGGVVEDADGTKHRFLIWLDRKPMTLRWEAFGSPPEAVDATVQDASGPPEAEAVVQDAGSPPETVDAAVPGADSPPEAVEAVVQGASKRPRWS